jgi:hypothetical protein
MVSNEVISLESYLILGQFQQSDLKLIEDRGLLCEGQDHDEVGHPAYLLPTPRQSLSSEHNI